MKEFFRKIHTDEFTWKDSVIVLVLLTILFVILSALVEIQITFGLEILLRRDPVLAEAAAMYYSFMSWWIVVVLFCLIVRRYRPFLLTLGKGMPGNTWKMFLLGLLIGFVMNGACILAAFLHKDIYIYPDSFKPLELIIIFIGVCIQSGAEEIVYRGFVYQNLRKGYRNPWVAILVSSFLFSLGHIFNPGITVLAFMNILLCGIVFALFVYYFDSLWIAIAVHAAWNYTQNIIFGLPNSGIVLDFSIFKLDAATATSSFFYHVDFGIEGAAITTTVYLLAGLIITFVHNRCKVKD